MLRGRPAVAVCSHFLRLTLSSAAMSTSTTPPVNLLDLASAAVACTVTASRSICKIAKPSEGEGGGKNTRLKDDGSFVTDADFAAQGVIVQALNSVSPGINIVGEESQEEMESHMGKHTVLDEAIFQRTKQEIRIRYLQKTTDTLPLQQTDKEESGVGETIVDSADDPLDVTVDVSRVSIFVDPLDGTKSYARGEYDSVSILIAVILDNQPCFGVIGKPFGYTGLTSILDTGCVTIYGGPLIKGVYIAGGERVVASPINKSAALGDLPRAVISSSRSKGVVHDFCVHLGEKGFIAPEPMLVSGAGEKCLRLILQQENEALWFFPKSGTSLWDVAASDALLRALGGKLTDKFGNEMDYSKTRAEAENMNGVIACINADLHEECIRLFLEGDWESQS